MRKGELGNFKVSRESSSSPLIIQIDFSNTGNTDITAGGTYHIMDADGMVYARGEFNDAYTFPGDKGALKAEWGEPIPAGKYDLIMTLNYGKALEEAKIGRGPLVTKESKIEMGQDGRVVSFGKLE
jgi:hypothetical protein